MTVQDYRKQALAILELGKVYIRTEAATKNATYTINKLKRALHAYDVARRKRARKGNR